MKSEIEVSIRSLKFEVEFEFQFQVEGLTLNLKFEVVDRSWSFKCNAWRLQFVVRFQKWSLMGKFELEAWNV